MPYCSRCGVELDAHVRRCPLCSTPVPVLDGVTSGEPDWPRLSSGADDPSKLYATPAQGRVRAFLTVIAFLLTGTAAVLATDLVLAGGVTWSRWPMVSLAAAFAYVVLGFLWFRRPRAVVVGGALTTAALLLALDLCDDGRLGWALTIGVPVTALTFLLVTVAALTVRRSRRLGYNVLALVPGLAALELLGIDALVSSWLGTTPLWGWSVITSLVLVPLTILFLFLHYALHRTPDLKRIFHF